MPTASFSTTPAPRAEADTRAIVSTAFEHIDRARHLLAMLSDITDGSEEIHMAGASVIGFKQCLVDTVNDLQSARGVLERITYSVPKLHRTTARAD